MNKTYIKYWSAIVDVGGGNTVFYYRAVHPDGRIQCRRPEGNWFDSNTDCFEWLPCSSREATNRGKCKPKFD